MTTYAPVLYYDSGQIATIILQPEGVLNYNGSDAYVQNITAVSPQVIGVFKPDLTAMSGFPVNMTALGVLSNVYIARFQLPSGLSSVGNYEVIVQYVDSQTSRERTKVYQLVVGTTMGNNSVVGI